MKATREELEELYHNQGLSLAKIAKELGVCTQTILNWMRSYGVPRRTLSEAWGVKLSEELERHIERVRQAGQKCKGSDRWNWKPDGSRFLDDRRSSGYIFIKHQSEWVPEHRLVMGQHLGRPLEEREEIHHRNRDKTDNRIENLELFPNHSEHMKAHNHRKKPQADGPAIEHSDA